MTTSSPHSLRRLLLASLAAAGTLAGPVGAVLASDDNPRAFNVESQMQAIKRYPDVLGFRIDAAPSLFPLQSGEGWLSPEHVQGVTRSQRPGMPHMYFSVSGDDGSPFEPGYITTVALQTRPVNGERLRSNRLSPQFVTRFAFPPFGDRPVNRFVFDGQTGTGNARNWGWRHPGNMSVIGDLLLTPLEDKLSDNPMSQETSLAILDISDPSRPVPVGIHGLNDSKAGTMAITRLPSGQYLVIIGGPDNGKTLVGYRSSTTNLRDPATTFSQVFRWNSDDNNFNESTSWTWPGNGGGAACAGKDAHQSYTFLTEQGTGRLYLVGTTKVGSCGSPFGVGTDVFDVFRVNLGANGSSMDLDFFMRQTVELNNSNEGMVGNFVAGGSTYVSQAGTIMLYTCPHGPGSTPIDSQGVSTSIMAFGELRPWYSTAMFTRGPGTANLELYDDDTYGDRSIVFDLEDAALRNWSNVGVIDDFNDRTSSLRWNAPSGFSFQLFQDSGRRTLLQTLGGIDLTAGLTSLDPNDAITSIGWTGSTGTTVFVNRNGCGGSICFPLGTATQPALSVAQGHGLVAGTITQVQITTGTYPERVRLAAPAVYRASGGAVRIGQ